MKNPVLDAIFSRRSVRAYKKDQVSDELVNELLMTAVHAANGMNTQPLRFVIVSNEEKLQEYSDNGKAMFLDAMKKAGFSEIHLETMLSNPNLMIFHNAPIAIFIYTSPQSPTPVEDGSLAAANIMLASESLGLGSCWIGFADRIAESPGFYQENNIPLDHRHVATVVVGYAKNEGAPTPRHDPIIFNWTK
jgi:nitroreductase